MRVPLQCAMLMYVTAVASGERTVRARGLAEEDKNTAGQRQRNLKKGEDRGGDYYYGFERHDPKALKDGARVSSKSPQASPSPALSRPSSSAPVSADADGLTDHTTQPSDSAPHPRKKKSDKSKKFKSKNSKMRLLKQVQKS